MAGGTAPITITPVASALLRTHDAEYYRRLALAIRTGEELPLETIETHLRSIGYEKRDPVEMVGEYSIRGGILDVFGAESAKPLRIEFFGDEVESIRRFDVESQRSVLKVPEAEILPLLEQPRHGDVFPGWEFAAASEDPRRHSLLELGRAPIVILDEPEDIRSASERLWKRLEQLKAEHSDDAAELAAANFFEWPEFEKALTGPVLNLRELAMGADIPHIATRPSLSFQGNMQVAVAEAKNLVERGTRVAFLAPSNGELERLADILREYSVPFQLGLAPNWARRKHIFSEGAGSPRRGVSRILHRLHRLRGFVRVF
jgi:transcription-repair coupling factor (superfamily II helicase)